MLKVNVSKQIGKNAISIQSGTKLYEVISPKLLAGSEVEIDFSSVSLYASPFFNASVGLMLKDISIDGLMRHMKIVGLNDIGKDLLNVVIQNAINFYEMDSKISNVLDESGNEE